MYNVVPTLSVTSAMCEGLYIHKEEQQLGPAISSPLLQVKRAASASQATAKSTLDLEGIITRRARKPTHPR